MIIKLNTTKERKLCYRIPFLTTIKIYYLEWVIIVYKHGLSD